MLDKTIQAKAVTLRAAGIPDHRALAKAEGTVIGALAALVGMLLCLGSVGIAGAVVLKGAELTLAVGLVIGIVGFVGFSLFGIGMSLISRDAAPLVGGVGDLLVKLITAWRKS